MASDVTLIISRRGDGVVVAMSWLGGNGVAEELVHVMGRAPDSSAAGFQSWGSVSAEQLSRLSTMTYADGPDPDEMSRLIAAYPTGQHFWCVVRDF